MRLNVQGLLELIFSTPLLKILDTPLVLKSIKSLDGDLGMDRCHYAVPFKGILIRSTPEIVLSSKQN